mmetsp:Transcript_33671/g.24698  ORF Transcript_33671/g.24698 Transcript_33671/m.24698 type:complete len:120 (+) Transcript_33671:770-1129(+)
MIAPTAIIRGAGMTFGIPIIEVEGTTGYYNSNLDNKFKKAVELFSENKYDFGFVHIKAVDDAGHDKNLQMKVDQLEKIDRGVKLLIEGLNDLQTKSGMEFIICITGDHTTPICIGDHTH